VGEVNVDGSGSSWTCKTHLYLANYGVAILNITNGGTVEVTGAVTRLANAITGGVVGTINISGSGSSMKTQRFDLSWERYSLGTVNISDGGLLACTDLLISADADPDSVIKISGGGMLALQGDGSASIAAFLDLMPDNYEVLTNTKNIDYWNGSTWDHIFHAVPGIDCDLTYYTSGYLADYTVFTVTASPPP
jgi:T5SS/PEP-CTERM-associated repeat protein